jgi:oligopeptide transport system substrate-binding protein
LPAIVFFSIDWLKQVDKSITRIAQVALMVLCFVVLPGCWRAESRAAYGTRVGILQYGNDTEPQDLDPHLVSGYNEQKVLWALFEGLVTLDPKTLEPIPGVAETWQLSPDGLVYTFKLRNNARWSNGDPLTANDFVFSWKRLLSPTLGAEYSYMLHVVKNAKAYNEGKIKEFGEVGVKAIDAHTLEVTLENPTPYFLSMQVHMTFFPVHQGCIERIGPYNQRATRWTQPDNFVSNGPFKLTEWKPDQVIRSIKSEHYWDAQTVKLNGIDFYPADNLQTEERIFRVGDLHLTSDLLQSKIDVYKQRDPSVLHINPICGTYFYRFNCKQEPFDDPRIRRALSLAINRQSIVDNVSRGDEKIAGSLCPPTIGGYTSVNNVEFNVEEAKRLFASAGIQDGKSLPPIDILFNQLESHQYIAEAIQQMWETELGVKATLSNQDWKVYLDSLNHLSYSVARSAWYADFLDPINFLECFTTDSGNNRTGWSNANYDALVERARRTVDPAERLLVLQDAEKILLDESPVAPIYYYTRKFLLSPDVKNWYANMLGYFNYKFVYLEKDAA